MPVMSIKITPKELKGFFFVVYNTEYNEFVTVLRNNTNDIHKAHKMTSMDNARSFMNRISPFNHIIMRVNATYEFTEVK